jgi:GntR family transcriptional regulator
VHAQIERWFLDAVARGELTAGDRLPREQDLAALFGVSRMTLRQALSALAGRGLVKRVPGRSGGTFVAEPKIECDLTGLAGFTEQLSRARVRAGARVVEARTEPATRAVAEALGIPVQEDVHVLVRVRTANRLPLMLERSYLPAEAMPGLLRLGLRGSLYSLLRKHYGLEPHHATEILDPVTADPQTADLLETEVGAPLLRITRTAFSASGKAVEYARDVLRPDRVRVVVHSGLTH